MSNRLNTYLSEKFYPLYKLTRNDLFNGLRPIEKSDGKSCSLVCPSCWGNDAFHYFGTASIRCNSCHQHTTLVSALCLLDEVTEQEAAKRLLESAGFALPPIVDITAEPHDKAETESKKSSAITTRWLLDQLRLWLKDNDDAIESLLSSGWEKELLFKAPIGYLPSSRAIQNVVTDRLPTSLYKSVRKIKNGIVVPWVLPNHDVFLWGYNDSLQQNQPSFDISIKPSSPCHLNHPVNLKSEWLLVVEDPILASLLLARRIPACAVGDESLSELSSKGLQGVKKSIFILAEADSVAVKNIQKYSPNAKVVEEVKPIAFGPYHGAYYRRFTKWHVSRFKKIATVVPNNVLSDEQIILMLSALVDAEMSFDEAVEVLEIKTGKRVTIAQVK
ncbi:MULTISPECIES: hypothetical protein [Vibrio]|uniref:hypothetical protein n=1 Tax=Vibrio TaxID=662 RepID=UPI001B80EEB1|nr:MULTISPECIES: hypothetical protein [Vibrio]MDF5646472.1 hypothetical protein [Vibrio parahaemolyticus]MDF5666270.1 hypothetical protein [Vibrio parahaemolyticus]WKV19524.1 hypothetical protein [Vibrio parahaemolyticus]HBC3404954.1 hypothetical protein [Vibrio parahaemolyticus]HBC3540152.1 hypothetical protein [Vibrio parahaemolyticus]